MINGEPQPVNFKCKSAYVVQVNDTYVLLHVTYTFYSCNMDTSDLPEMLAQNLRVQSKDVGIHFRQITIQ